MAKYNIYAIARGVDPNTGVVVTRVKVHTWKECEPYVKGIEGAKYKGFLTDVEADSWMDRVLADSDEENVKTPNQFICNNAPPSYPVKDVDAVKSRFVDICRTMNVRPNEMVNKLMENFVNMHNFIYGNTTNEEDNLYPFDDN